MESTNRFIIIEYEEPELDPKVKNFSDLINWAFEHNDKYLLKRAIEAIQLLK